METNSIPGSKKYFRCICLNSVGTALSVGRIFSIPSPPPHLHTKQGSKLYWNAFPIYEHLFEYIGTQFPPPSSLLYGKMGRLHCFFQMGILDTLLKCIVNSIHRAEF